MAIIFYVGATCGCVFISRAMDVYGRRKSFLICLGAQLGIYTMILGSHHYALTAVLLFLMGICTAGRYNGSWIVVTEFVHSNHKTKVALLLLTLDQLIVVITALYFKYEHFHWRYLQLAGILFTLVSFIGCLMIPESPEYLYSFYRFNDCTKVFKRIGVFNQNLDLFNSHFQYDTEFEMKFIRHMIKKSKRSGSKQVVTITGI